MENLTDLDELITCPYDKAHSIRKRCMSQHLTKCRVNHPNAQMVPCDFNATHMIPEPERQYHHQLCVNRKNIEVPLYGILEQSSSKYPISNIEVVDGENWDDTNCNTYNPQEYLERNSVLQSLNTRSKSERKNFRVKERHRLANLNENPKPKENQVNHQQKFINLPPARPRPNVPSNVNVDRSELIREAIRRGANKVYMQHENPNNV